MCASSPQGEGSVDGEQLGSTELGAVFCRNGCVVRDRGSVRGYVEGKTVSPHIEGPLTDREVLVVDRDSVELASEVEMIDVFLKEEDATDAEDQSDALIWNVGNSVR